jgi:hypothetical protein
MCLRFLVLCAKDKDESVDELQDKEDEALTILQRDNLEHDEDTNSWPRGMT